MIPIAIGTMWDVRSTMYNVNYLAQVSNGNIGMGNPKPIN